MTGLGFCSEHWKKPITQDRLKAVLSYNPKTGVFTKLAIRKGRWQKCPYVGSLKESGYRHISIDGLTYRAHRLAWLYVYGCFHDQIDHVDRDRDNNAIANLRACNFSENGANRPAYQTNTSGYKGVSFCRTSNRWRATVTFNYKTHHVGRFDTKEEAYAAYVSAASRLFGEFHGV